MCYREQKAGSPEQKGQHVQRIVDKRDPGPVRKCRQGIRAKILIFITLTPGSVCRNPRAQGVGGAQSSEGLSVKSLPASRNETQSRRLRTSPEAPSLKLGGPLPSETDTGKKSPGIQVTIQTARTSDPIGIGHHLVSEDTAVWEVRQLTSWHEAVRAVVATALPLFPLEILVCVTASPEFRQHRHLLPAALSWHPVELQPLQLEAYSLDCKEVKPVNPKVNQP